MTNNTVFENQTDDAALVAECLEGNRDAFGSIVRRYQALICALTYNATGRLSESEDLAQETFLTAWRQLAGLREPAKLRPWLCRIARNLSCDALKRQGREPVEAAETLEATTDFRACEPTPCEGTMTKEEEAILWRSLERLPGVCREPLILFYREHRSIADVAAALDLSEDAVKQRLSRGRKLLAEQVLAYVEGALERTGPSPVFAQGVMLALPAMSVSTTTASVAGSAVKSGAGVKAATGGLLAVIWSMLLVVFGNYAGYRAGLALAESDGEKRVIRRFYAGLLVAVAGASVAFSLLVWWQGGLAAGRREGFAAAMLVFTSLGVAVFFGLSFWFWRANRASAARTANQPKTAAAPAWEYRSRASFLGLPLVHIRVGGSNKAVRAWFAAGGCAVGGLFAFGGLAIAPVSIGGLALGLMSWGGTSAGLLALGGLAVGVWSLGGLAVGWNACGACAVAWKAAGGEAALAHDFAFGKLIQAAHAGDAAAQSYVDSSQFFQCADWFMRHSAWLNLIWVAPLALWWLGAARARRRGVMAIALALFLGGIGSGFAQDAPKAAKAAPVIEKVL
ncbi:MAG TPA: RNA polymerase sigma factor [Verrucomicrobiae bacterium]|jgi:RNA polymerase sigma factor (sigma-70 family)